MLTLLGTLDSVNKIGQMLAILVNRFSTFFSGPMPCLSPLNLFLCKGQLNIVQPRASPQYDSETYTDRSGWPPCGQCYFEGQKRRSILCLIFWRVKNPFSFLLILFNPAWVQEEATCPFCGYLRRRRLWETGWRMQRSLSKDSHLGKDVTRNDPFFFIP